MAALEDHGMKCVTPHLLAPAAKCRLSNTTPQQLQGNPYHTPICVSFGTSMFCEDAHEMCAVLRCQDVRRIQKMHVAKNSRLFRGTDARYTSPITQ